MLIKKASKIKLQDDKEIKDFKTEFIEKMDAIWKLYERYLSETNIKIEHIEFLVITNYIFKVQNSGLI